MGAMVDIFGVGSVLGNTEIVPIEHTTYSAFTGTCKMSVFKNNKSLIYSSESIYDCDTGITTPLVPLDEDSSYEICDNIDLPYYYRKQPTAIGNLTLGLDDKVHNLGIPIAVDSWYYAPTYNHDFENNCAIGVAYNGSVLKIRTIINDVLQAQMADIALPEISTGIGGHLTMRAYIQGTTFRVFLIFERYSDIIIKSVDENSTILTYTISKSNLMYLNFTYNSVKKIFVRNNEILITGLIADENGGGNDDNEGIILFSDSPIRNIIALDADQVVYTNDVGSWYYCRYTDNSIKIPDLFVDFGNRIIDNYAIFYRNDKVVNHPF